MIVESYSVKLLMSKFTVSLDSSCMYEILMHNSLQRFSGAVLPSVVNCALDSSMP